MYNYDLILKSLKLVTDNKRFVINYPRQLGKSYTLKLMYDLLDKIKNSHYIKKFYLRSGTFVFKLYYKDNSCELIKEKGNWGSTNFDYIIKFLYHRGAKLEDIVEIEKEIFKRT
jgi:hypothetical protein